MSTNYEIISKEETSLSEALDIIEKKEESQELTYREDKVKEFLKRHSKLSYEDFVKAKEEILSLEIPRLEELHIIKILDIMPKTGTELRAIVSHSGVILVDENSQKILDTLKKY